MNKRIRILFLLLIIAHVIHATEEYIGKLWEVYTPAIFICNLVAPNPQTGFIIINSVFVIVSLAYWGSLRKNTTNSYSSIWLWMILQTLNVTGHIAWTINKRAYTPGIVSTFVILVIVILLVKQLLDRNGKATKSY
ncbi:MAG TPA: HXXEE domain-containing protein [Chitinophagaceae bacterium]|nr:HXXEE domain-containing protein [Chitinophagaceae bacterium]